MKFRLFKVSSVILTIIILFGISFIPLSNGNSLSVNSLIFKKIILNNKYNNSYDTKDNVNNVNNLFQTEDNYLIRDRFNTLHLSNVTNSIILHNKKNQFIYVMPL